MGIRVLVVVAVEIVEEEVAEEVAVVGIRRRVSGDVNAPLPLAHAFIVQSTSFQSKRCNSSDNYTCPLPLTIISFFWR